MIRRLIKPAYSHAPWKNPTHPPVYKGKRSPSKVLGGKVSTAEKAQKEETLVVVPTTVPGWNMFPLIEGFTTFWKILKKS